MKSLSKEEKSIENRTISNKLEIEAHVAAILDLIGEDVQREGLLKTPHRVAKMYSELFEGYFQDLNTLVNGAIYHEDQEGDDIIFVGNIEYKSTCEHHMLPFMGTAHIGYIPASEIIGLSKIPRVVNMFARRLQVQERLTKEIVQALEKVLKPKGVIAILEGHHECASLRGVMQEHLNMKTTSSTGVFSSDSSLRSEFMNLI